MLQGLKHRGDALIGVAPDDAGDSAHKMDD
jgi:hypothetical protein